MSDSSIPNSLSSSLVITVGAASSATSFTALSLLLYDFVSIIFRSRTSAVESSSRMEVLGQLLGFAFLISASASGPSCATTAFCASVNSVSPSAKILSASASTAA